MRKKKSYTGLFTWGVKVRDLDYVLMYNVTQEEALRVAASLPGELRAAAIPIRRCLPKNLDSAKIVHIGQLAMEDTL